MTRPSALAAAVGASAIAALFNIASAIGVFVNGRAAITEFLGEELGGVDASNLGSTTSAAIDEAYGALAMKGWVGIFSAVITLILAIAALKGRTVMRILLAMFLLGNLCSAGLLGVEADVLPDLSLVAAFAALVLSLASIPLLFLPTVNRYAKRP